MQRLDLKKDDQILVGKKVYRVGIAVSSYHSDITYSIRDAAYETLKKAGIKEKNIFTVEVRGAFEVPLLCKKMIQKHKLSGVVAIGCVIKGDTDHYHFIASESARGIMDVMLKTGIPVTNAILTVNNLEQAKIRSKGDMNKGVEAADALVSVLNTIF